jgi:hypothetical protein
MSPKQETQAKLPTVNQELVKTEAIDNPFVPASFDGLPDLSDIVVCPSETGSNSYDCLLEAILLPIQYRDIFVGLRSPWKGGNHHIATVRRISSWIYQCYCMGHQEQESGPKLSCSFSLYYTKFESNMFGRKNQTGTSRLQSSPLHFVVGHQLGFAE